MPESLTDRRAEPDELSLVCEGFGARVIIWDANERCFAPIHRRAASAGGESIAARLDRLRNPVPRAPAAEEWRDFWTILDNCGVWHWQACYNAAVVCGTPFELKISYAGRTLHSSGNLAGDDPPPHFELFDRALCALSGRDFRSRKEAIADLRRVSEFLLASTTSPEAAADHLRALLRDNVLVGNALESAIERLGPQAQALVPVLLNQRTADEKIAREIACALARIG